MRHTKHGGLGWRADTPDHDFIYGAPYAIMRLGLPETSDLRPTSPPIWNQGSIGSCVSHGVGYCVEFDWMRQGLPNFIPSRLFNYYCSRVLENSVSIDAGCMIRDAIKVIAKQGAPHEHEWPYDVTKFMLKPPAKAYTDALLRQAVRYYRVVKSGTQIKACLAEGFPVVFGCCLHGDTLIHTPAGDQTIRELVGQTPWVFSWQGDNLRLAKAKRVWLAKKDVDCVRVTYEWHAHGERKTNSIICTPSHPFMMLDGSYTKAGILSPGDRLTPFGQKVGRPGNGTERATVKISGLKKGEGAWQKRSHWVWEQLHGDRPKGAHIHHSNGNTMDDRPENLEAMDGRLHVGQHSREWWEASPTEIISARNGRVAVAQNNRSLEHAEKIAAAARLLGEKRRGIPQGQRSEASKANMRASWTEERRAAQSERMAERNRKRLAGKAMTVDRQYEMERNHKVVSVEPWGTTDVFDIEVPEFHNFAANNVFVHNSVFESFESDAVANTGVVPMPRWGEENLGGHCMVIVGHDDRTQRFLIRNSWGINFGMSGYLTMPYAYITGNLSSDFWTIRLMEATTT